MHTKPDIKTTIGKNIMYLMGVYGMSRKDLCDETGIKYTTLCDWLSAKSYPKIETLEMLAGFFSIGIQDFFIEIEKNEELNKRIREYARRMDMEKDYSDTYSEGFWELCGSLENIRLEEPEDMFPEDDIEVF